MGADSQLKGRSADPETQRALEDLRQRIARRDPLPVTGSRASGAALLDLLHTLEAAGVIIDNTTA